VCAGPGGDPFPQCAISTAASPEIAHDPEAVTDSPLGAQRLGLEGARVGLHGVVSPLRSFSFARCIRALKARVWMELVMTIKLRND
jgi:hypothetical protein